MSRALSSLVISLGCLLWIPLACSKDPAFDGSGSPGDGDGDGDGTACEDLFGDACGSPCDTENPCPSGMHCRAGKCDAECKTNAHCSGTQTCSSSGLCEGDIVPPGDGDGDSCEPQTCEEVGFACGMMIDRCDNIIDCAEEGLSCGSNYACAGNPTECVPVDNCEVCDKIPDCSDQDQFTVLRGRVVSPGRNDDDTANQVGIPNALVYIMRSTDIDELPPISTGLPEDGTASCDRCEDQDHGPVLAGAVTDATGLFEINERIPLDTDIILVVKAGKFRRATVLNLPEEDACTDIELPTDAANNPARLPRRSDDGLAVNIPHIAIATGAIDGMECVFRKMGVDPEEFGSPGTDQRIHLYRSNGAWPPDTECTGCVACARCAACGTGSGTTDSNCRSRYCTETGTGSCNSTCRTNFINACRPANCTADGAPSCTTGGCQDDFLAACQENIDAALLTEEDASLPNYDLAVFSCEGAGWDSNINRSATAVREYANRGGRVFASHLSFTWLHEDADSEHGSTPYDEDAPFLTGLGPAANWVESSVTSPSSGTGRISVGRDNVSPRIENFTQWMISEGVVDSADDTFTIIDPRSQVQNSDTENGLGPSSEEFVYCESGTNGCANQRAQQFSFTTPYAAPENNVCGRVAYSGFHVSSGGNTTAFEYVVFPSYCEDDTLGNGGILTDQEKILLYMLFDLGACVGDDPPNPPCVPVSCPDNACGIIPNQCGGVLDCGTCVPMPPR